jgi:ribonuclease P protein component
MKNTLKNKEEIDKIFKSGKSITEGVVRAKFLESSSETKFLFAASSSKFKRSVDKNRIKRLMRESVKGVTITGKSIAFIFIGDGVPEFDSVKKSIDKIVSKI